MTNVKANKQKESVTHSRRNLSLFEPINAPPLFKT